MLLIKSKKPTVDLLSKAIKPLYTGLQYASSAVIDNPVLQSLQSPFKVARQVSQEIADPTGLKIQKGELGIPIAKGGTIESLNKIKNGYAIKANIETNDLFLQYRKKEASFAGNFQAEVTDFLTPKESRKLLTEAEFFDEVGNAQANGDKHENPFIAKAAQAYRREVTDPIMQEAQEVGIFDGVPDVKTAESYVMRMWDSFGIKQNKKKFIDISHDWLIEVQNNNNMVKQSIESLASLRDALIKDNKKSEKSISSRQNTLKVSEAKVTEGFKFLKDIRDRMPVGESSLVNYNKFYDFNKSVLTELEDINNLNVDIANKEISDALPEITSQLEDIFVSKKTALQDKLKFNAMIKKVKTLTKQPKAKETTQGQMFDVPVKELKSGVREFEPRVKYPTLSLFKGEINTNGFFASELKAMDITPKTMPSYFSKTGKYKNIDNINPTDMDILAEALGRQGSKDYLDPDDILDAIRSEFAGKPLFMFDDDVIKKQNYEDVIAFKNELENLGIDFNSQDDNLFDQYKSLKNKQSDIVDFNIDSGGVDLNDLESVSEQINFYDKAEALLPSLKNKIEDAIAKIQKIDPLKRAEIDNRLKSMIDNVNEFEKQIKAQRIKIDKIEKTLAKKQRELGLVQNERGVINKNATRRAKNTTMAFLKKRDEYIQLKRKLNKNTIELSDLDEQIKINLQKWQGRTLDDLMSEKIDLDEAIRNIRAKDTAVSEQELRITAGEIADQIISTPDGRLGYYDKSTKSSGGFSQNDEYTPNPFKSRTFMIPDNRVKEFLVRDARILARRYASNVGSYINMHKRFDGDVDLLNAKREIMAEANAMIDKNPKKSQEIQAEADKAIRNLAVLRDRALGRDLLPSDPTSKGVRVSRFLRQVNLITMLGDVTLSSVSDVARTVLAGNTTFKNAVKVFKFSKEAKLKRQEFARLGVVAELVAKDKFIRIQDIGDAGVAKTPLEKTVGWLVDKFGYVSGFSYWQQAVKQISAMTTEDSIIRNIQDFVANPTTSEAKVALAHNGIDFDLAQRILQEFKTHGEDFKGVNLLNAEKWQDKDALNSLLSAVISETDRIIVTPGFDKSVNLNSSEFIITLTQFKSFFISSTTKTLMRGVQDGFEKNNIVSFSMMMSLGMLIYASKTIEAGRELSDNPAVWLIEGFDRAGIGGIFSEVNNISEKAFGLGVRPLVGGDVSSRYQSRSAADSLMGPSFGRLVNTFNLLRGIKEGELTNQDINTIMTYVPYGNTPALSKTGTTLAIKKALGKDN